MLKLVRYEYVSMFLITSSTRPREPKALVKDTLRHIQGVVDVAAFPSINKKKNVHLVDIQGRKFAAVRKVVIA